MATKGDIVRAALRKAAIASNATLTDVEPESMADGLFDLELMMSELDGNGIRVGFILAGDNPPQPDDNSGLPDWALAPVIANLCVYVLPDYVRDANPIIASRAAFGMQTLVKSTANITTPKYRYPNGWPMGSGNILYRRVGIRYFHFGPKIDVENDGSLEEIPVK
ncbi:MAG: packaged DNA stabilization gp4 family protein [Shewanella sp.]